MADVFPKKEDCFSSDGENPFEVEGRASVFPSWHFAFLLLAKVLLLSLLKRKHHLFLKGINCGQHQAEQALLENLDQL